MVANPELSFGFFYFQHFTCLTDELVYSEGYAMLPAPTKHIFYCIFIMKKKAQQTVEIMKRKKRKEPIRHRHRLPTQ